MHPNEPGAGPVRAWLNKTRGWSIGRAQFIDRLLYEVADSGHWLRSLSSLGGSNQGREDGGGASSYLACSYVWKVILHNHSSSLWLVQLMAHKCTWLHKRCRNRWMGGVSGSRQWVQRQEKKISGHVLMTWWLASLNTGPELNLIINNIKVLKHCWIFIILIIIQHVFLTYVDTLMNPIVASSLSLNC